MTIKIRSAYSKREPVNQPLSGLPSRTKQEFKKEVNINEIVARMRKGISPPAWMTSSTPRYGDFTDMPTSFQEAYSLIETAEAAFKSLPLEFRRALDHNPAKLDSAPRELYEQFGLLKAKGDTPSVSPQDSTGQAVTPARSAEQASKGSLGAKNAKKIEPQRGELADE